MGRDFNKELDDLFDQDERLLTKEVEVVSDADCDVFCDGDRISHLTSGIPSMVRVTRRKHTFVFKAAGGRSSSKTVEIGDSPISISVSGLKEEPTSTASSGSPQSSSPFNPTQDETAKASDKPKEGHLLYWIFGALCGFLLLLILIVNANNNTPSSPAPTSIPTSKPTSPVSNSDASRSTPQASPSSGQNSSQIMSQQNSTANTPSSSSSASNTTETQPSSARSNTGSFSLSRTEVSIFAGDMYSLSASGGKVDRWETSNQGVATVNQNGLIFAHGEGSTTIRAISGGSVRQCIVTVKEFSLSPSSFSLRVGEQKSLSANATVDKWESDNVKVATVNSRGVVTSVGEGSTTIWAYHGSKLKLCNVTVTKANSGQAQTASSTDFSLKPGKCDAKVGDKFVISATGPVDKWESDNEKVATVNYGVVTCVGVGSTNIWAHHGSELKRCTVTVTGSANQSSATAKPTTPTTITVSSTVKDNKGNALVGAAVLVKGTTNGTSADINGKFSLRVSSDAVIVVTSVKYKSQEFKATEVPNTITLFK